MCDESVVVELRQEMSVQDLLARGLEKERQAEEAVRKQEEEHDQLMIEAYRARDAETASAIPNEIASFLVPTQHSLRYLPDTIWYSRVIQIPEYAPIRINLIKYLDRWRLAYKAYSDGWQGGGYQNNTYEVHKAVFDENELEVCWLDDDRSLAYMGNDVELALVAAKREYHTYQAFQLKAEEIKVSRDVEAKEQTYEEVDPPVPNDQAAVEALFRMIDARVKIAIDNING